MDKKRKIYTAVIGDIRNSRAITSREGIQQELHNVLKEINEKYKDTISANFLITLGDEFQGLLSKPDKVLEIMRFIENRLYPVKIRFGVGMGEITTSINREMALGADGPAYYAARAAITEVKNKERKNNTLTNIRFAAMNVNINLEQINLICDVLRILEKKWTTKQAETIKNMEEYGGNQKECAERLKINQSNVSRRLEDSGYNTYKQLIKMAEKSIEEISKNPCFQ